MTAVMMMHTLEVVGVLSALISASWIELGRIPK